jgi:DNA topoisomerase-3
MDELDEIVELPPIKNGEIVQVVSVSVKSLKTKPPSHYTEGTLIATMKNAASLILDDPKLKSAFKAAAGLGTAATRANVIDELKEDGMMLKKGKKLYPSENAINMIQWLNTHAPQTVDVKMSAIWESKLNSFVAPGDGATFERQFREELVALIETLKSARPLATRGTNSSTEKNMSDNNAPSNKQLEFASKIAQKLGIDLPEDVLQDRKACSAFIEANQEAALRPSAKQIAFAENIAKNKGLTVPPAAMKDGRELSKWIDENKG